LATKKVGNFDSTKTTGNGPNAVEENEITFAIEQQPNAECW
jgi:hypothetical protein